MSQLPAGLIDRFLSEHQFSEHHARRIPAPADQVYAALWTVDFSRSLAIRWLFEMRGLGQRIRRDDGRLRIRVADFLAAGFLLLAEQPGVEVVFGQTWGPTRVADATQFLALSAAGHVKIAMNFLLRPEGRETVLSTETRVLTTDPVTRRAFARYWFVVGPFSALIRRRMLAMLRAEVTISLPG